MGAGTWGSHRPSTSRPAQALTFRLLQEHGDRSCPQHPGQLGPPQRAHGRQHRQQAHRSRGHHVLPCAGGWSAAVCGRCALRCGLIWGQFPGFRLSGLACGMRAGWNHISAVRGPPCTGGWSVAVCRRCALRSGLIWGQFSGFRLSGLACGMRAGWNHISAVRGPPCTGGWSVAVCRRCALRSGLIWGQFSGFRLSGLACGMRAGWNHVSAVRGPPCITLCRWLERCCLRAMRTQVRLGSGVSQSRPASLHACRMDSPGSCSSCSPSSGSCGEACLCRLCVLDAAGSCSAEHGGSSQGRRAGLLLTRLC